MTSSKTEFKKTEFELSVSAMVHHKLLPHSVMPMKSIKFTARCDEKNRKPSRSKDYFISSIQNRLPLTSREKSRIRDSRSKIAKKLPLNRIVIKRIFGKAHSLTHHSPKLVAMRNKDMGHFWNTKFDRKGVSCAYHNTYTLNKFL